MNSEQFFVPHAEEPVNPSATLANTNANAVLNKWLTDWEVPNQYWEFWTGGIDIRIYEVYPPDIISMGIKQETPAVTWDAGGKRHLAIKPSWFNPGVIAHEQAHNSYALLSADQKTDFSNLFTSLKNSDPLMKFVFSKNAYGLSSDVEGHAEVYRYIGQYMLGKLKRYYPRLF